MIQCTLFSTDFELSTSMEAIPPVGVEHVVNDTTYVVTKTVWVTKTKNTMSITGRTEVRIYLVRKS